MEYMTLTGYSVSNFSPTLPVPYTQLVGKLKVNPSIVDSFNHAVAIHPYIGTFYNRTSVYSKFGFELTETKENTEWADYKMTEEKWEVELE